MTRKHTARPNQTCRTEHGSSRGMSNQLSNGFNYLNSVNSSQLASINGPQRFSLGSPNTSAEREAEQTADQIIRTPPTPTLESNHSTLDKQTAPPTDTHPILGEKGRKLDDDAQQWLEGRFKTDFSTIKIHTNESAQQSANSMHAKAYTLGNHIVFAKDEYRPRSNKGRHLLAHELTHSLQQSNSPKVQCKTQQLVQRSLKTYITAMNEKPEPNWALAAEHLNGEGVNTIRTILKRLPEMYRAKLHKAARSWPGICSNISRLTETDYLKHIDPTAKKVNNSCSPAPEKKKQKNPKKGKSSRKNRLRKKNRALKKKSPTEIMADKKYFENGIESINYFYGDWAILNYSDGSTMKLGLVPEQIKSPIKGVNFRSLKSEHLVIPPSGKNSSNGKIRFVPRGNEAIYPDDFTIEDFEKVLPDVTRTIKFKYHKNGRIVPTEVNSITAPRLTQALRAADKQYIAGFTSMAKQLKVMEWVLIVHSLGSPGLKAAGAATGAKAVTPGVLGRARGILNRFFSRLLKSGATENIVIEGVGFGSVRVLNAGTELVVSRVTIENISRVAGRGKLVHSAFEQAAIQTAKSVGAKTVRVSLKTVQNMKWATYLESQGYAFQVLKNDFGGFSKVLTKVFTL